MKVRFVNRTYKSTLSIAAYFFGLLMCAVPWLSHAKKGDVIQWQSNNIQLLKGWDYQVGKENRTVATFEHANSWRYGDVYMFADYIWPQGASSTYYIEPTLRFSLNKITGKNLSRGALKDVLLAFQIEKPKGQDIRKLYGIGMDWQVSDFKFIKTNFLVRDNPNLSGQTYQLNIAWNKPFELFGYSALFEGFTDIVGSEGQQVPHQLFVPRLLVDISSWVGVNEKSFWLGTEWQYWHNKFGIDGVTESVPQIQMKYVF